jgi:hypothetical protein
LDQGYQVESANAVCVLIGRLSNPEFQDVIHDLLVDVEEQTRRLIAAAKGGNGATSGEHATDEEYGTGRRLPIDG